MVRAVLPARHFIRRIRRRAPEVLVPISTGYDQSSRDLGCTTRSGTRRRDSLSCRSTGRTIQLDTGQESHMTRVAVRDSSQTGHNVLQSLGGVAHW